MGALGCWLTGLSDKVLQKDRFVTRIVLDERTRTWFRQFIDALTIHSGQRKIQLLHPGTGNTPGDLVMWLPQEKILAIFRPSIQNLAQRDFWNPAIYRNKANQGSTDKIPPNFSVLCHCTNITL